jgi:molybdenum cofactor cytidylyltransferase
VAALVLAAGASRRLGSPKQMALLGGETLLERSVRVACEAGLAPVVVVVGAEWELVLTRSSLGDAITVVNEHWTEGMASSIRLGIETLKLHAREAAGGVLMTCDQPALTVEHLQRLAASVEVKASRYAGKKGVPAFFPRDCFDCLLTLHGDGGARELMVNARSVEFVGGELDVDTTEDLEKVRELFGVPGNK